MMRGSTPALAQPVMRASGLRPRSAAHVVRGEHERRAAVGDARRGAGGDDARLPFDRWGRPAAACASASRRRAVPRMLVGSQTVTGLPRAPPDRRDLACEVTGLLRGLRLALTLEREGIGLVARDAVLPRQHLGGLAHDEVRQRIGEAVAVHRVDELGNGPSCGPSARRWLSMR